MVSGDIGKVAVTKINNELLYYSDYLSGFVNKDDTIPLWDGSIYIYNNKQKTNKDFEGKIDVQVKGRNVKKFNEKSNTFPFEVETLKGYQKEVKGTLLLVVDFIDNDNYRIYYCNLLPVDLYGILNGISETQKSVSLKLKLINKNSAITLKNVCLNFYSNSKKQIGKKIIQESDFDKIEDFNFLVISDETNIEDYIINGDVYGYATLKGTKEEVVTIKPINFTPYKDIKHNISINNKHYYSKITILGKDTNESIIIGCITLQFNNNLVKLNFSNDLNQKIKELNFILDLFEHRYINIDGEKLTVPFNNEKQIKKNIEICVKTLKYCKKIKEVFKYFGINFDIPLNDLSQQDEKNINILLSLYDGHFSDKIKCKKYIMKINKYSILFIPWLEKNKIMNFYSEELINNFICFTNKGDTEIKFSIYSQIEEIDFVNISNFNEKIFLKSFKNIDICDETLDIINNILLKFISTYDRTKNDLYLRIANNLSLLNCKNRNNDIDIINSKQIKMRKNKLSNNDKHILSEISNKQEYKNDYTIQCCISLLIDNKFNFQENYSKMTKKEKDLFKKYPIFNLK